VVVAETHGAAEGLWHGVDPAHPLHALASASVAATGVAGIYRAVDRLVAEVLEATQPETAFVFSLGGMGSNHSDVASMALLPELLLRWSLGERLLAVPEEWAADPAVVPSSPHPNADFMRAWYPEVARRDRPGAARALARRLPASVRKPFRRVLGPQSPAARDAGGLPPGAPRPAGYQEPTWQPAAWYQPWWPRMRAFALPSFYDGRVRINLRGRERDGLVEPADYDRVCDEVEALVRACVDPRTGRPVVAQVERPAGRADPVGLDSAQADLVVEWNDCTAAFEHPVHGVVGPLPFRRTGGHTGPSGFAYVEGPGFGAGDRGAASSFDVAASIAALLAGHPVDGLSGSPLPLQPVG
jgi:predicted AlkP superfamily phosphohydrolase/phosphomutase